MVRLLVAAGVQAVGIDPVEARCRLAEKAGAALAGSPDDLDTLVSGLAAITSGRGADHIFLAAGGHTNGPVEAAVKLARDRARVVDIGKMKLDLPWNAYYEKELDVRFSRSYGPGRYDDRYELEGIDYPVGYVRWTEKRNLESFLELLARGSLEVATLIDGVFPFDDAAKVYGDLKDGTLKAVGVLLEYEQPAAGRPEARHEQGARRARSHRPFGMAERASPRCGSASSARETTPRPCCCRTWRSWAPPAWRTSRPPSRCRRSTRRRSSASPRPRPTPTRSSATRAWTRSSS